MANVKQTPTLHALSACTGTARGFRNIMIPQTRMTWRSRYSRVAVSIYATFRTIWKILADLALACDPGSCATVQFSGPPSIGIVSCGTVPLDGNIQLADWLASYIFDLTLMEYDTKIDKALDSAVALHLMVLINFRSVATIRTATDMAISLLYTVRSPLRQQLRLRLSRRLRVGSLYSL